MSLQRHQRYVMVDLDHEEDEEATRGLVGGQASGGGHGERGTHGGGVVAGCAMAHSYLWFCDVRLVCSQSSTSIRALMCLFWVMINTMRALMVDLDHEGGEEATRGLAVRRRLEADTVRDSGLGHLYCGTRTFVCWWCH
jgi:hypothetical protein